jgi:hypothetical protein
MLTFLMHTITAWSDYFTGNPTLLQSNLYGTRQAPASSNGGVYVSNCLFRSISSTEYGGALHCSSSVTLLLVESSSFFSCSTSGQSGGAIYFSNTNNGQCVFYGLCGYDCYSTYTNSDSYGQFSRVDMCNGASNKNYINYSSIARCVIESPRPHYTLLHQYGKHLYPSLNSSLNKCYYCPGICCTPYTDSNSVTCSFSYFTFADNIVTSVHCIWLVTTGAKYEIKSCNFLRNVVASSSRALIRSDGNLMIYDSCILENTATYTFYAWSSYSITLSNCTIDKTTRTGSLIIQNTAAKSFILALNHMSTLNCHSEYDSAGTLTPIMQSSSKKQIQCCTCGRLLCQPQLSDVVSLTIILFFNFIHPYASIDFWC